LFVNNTNLPAAEINPTGVHKAVEAALHPEAKK